MPFTARHVRPAVLDGDGSTLRPALPAASSPTVYFTLGTIFHQESGDLFHRVLFGLAALAVEIVVTVGHEIDPAELGRQPENVRVKRFVDADEILSGSDLVVSHGGSGTVIGALAFGVPQILLPMGADQPLNADRCRDLGVAAILNASTASGPEVARTAQAVLEDDSYRLNASVLGEESHSLPGCEHAAALLQGLTLHESAPRD